MHYLIFSTCAVAILVCSIGPTEAGPLDYNMMSCMDFARHMSSTVPSRFGLLGGEEAAAAAAQAVPEAVAKRQSGLSSVLPSSVTNFSSTVTNVANQNVANCQSAERHSFCVSIDDFLEQNFPQWFFEYQVTNNMNHVLGQMTTHRYHSLFEATLKAYKCFCQC